MVTIFNTSFSCNFLEIYLKSTGHKKYAETETFKMNVKNTF